MNLEKSIGANNQTMMAYMYMPTLKSGAQGVSANDLVWVIGKEQTKTYLYHMGLLCP